VISWESCLRAKFKI